uniref:Uncharacterized protein n=1 Tax=Arion vulgaris TaxID=1028688 RepID=A0A0B7AQ58_9EUPU
MLRYNDNVILEATFTFYSEIRTFNMYNKIHMYSSSLCWRQKACATLELLLP